MNKKLVGYWVTTALFCLVMTADGVASLLRIERQQAIMEVLGYPPYLMTLLGIPSCAVLPPSSVATPCLNANVSWPACVGERH